MKIVNQKQFENELVVLRYPELTDAEAMSEYINTLSKEESFISFQGEQLSVEDEQEFLEGFQKKREKGQSVMLLAFVNDQLIGISGLSLRSRAEDHVGDFGISIHAEYRGKGIGKFLMESIIAESLAQMEKLKIIVLGVFEQNDIARNLYTKLGFSEFGTLPKGLRRKGEYQAHVYMYKEVRD